MRLISVIVRIVIAIAALAVALRLIAFALGVVGLLFKLIWLAVILGAAGLICWVGYKLFFSGRTA